ncbi:putative lipid II flippase FtsW [Candidatus Aerophobetes bacterium]|uniref:Probable peptidoglycan glycosyltransferase FtsW n=1 Tax=Aerophobetes bacterium TaxID=2030807 RepID=A0A523TGR1_UNCAE|nr:MAG: putative lipid II flippase FtsW [Candidatus Aerophobetes bacterium]
MKSKTDIDYSLLIITLSLLAVGLIILFSASGAYAYLRKGDSYFFIKRQLIWAALGLVFLWIGTRFNYQRYQKLAIPLLLLTLGLLAAVLLPHLGGGSKGAHRWINLGFMGLGFIHFQPSEIAKLSLVIYLASSLVRKRQKMENFINGFLPYFIILGAISIMVVMEPDLGSAIIIAMIAFVLLFAGGARISHMVYALILALVPLCFSIFEVGYRKDRIMAFLHPELDPQGVAFQPLHFKIALGSGGLWGLGPGKGQEKLFYLPTPHTDSIFAVIGEEFGFIGTTLIVILFFAMALRGLKIARRAPDALGKLLAVGLTSIICLQAAVNMAVVTVILPTTGTTLPFISYGGSSLLICLTAVGILLNISKTSLPKPEPDDE